MFELERAPKRGVTKQVALVFMELYSELGDNIALQYGGSEAHKKVSGGSGGGGKQVRRALMHRDRHVFPPQPPSILKSDLVYVKSACS